MSRTSQKSRHLFPQPSERFTVEFMGGGNGRDGLIHVPVDCDDESTFLTLVNTDHIGRSRVREHATDFPFGHLERATVATSAW